MDKSFHRQAQLLLRLLPEIAKDKNFALHGGTAINLFYHNMPRLSVDIDLTWIPYGGRENDLQQIRDRLLLISSVIKKAIPAILIREPVTEDDELKLYCTLTDITVKVEVNTVNRGVLGETIQMQLCEAAQKNFDSYCEVQTVPVNQLFGGKLVAALDRQHPRDLFDCRKMLESTGYTNDIHTGFMFCLLSSKRPFHEILKPRFINQEAVFRSQFSGMTDEQFTYELFEEVRLAICEKINASLSNTDKALLKSFAKGEPVWPDDDWSVYPGIQWKLINIQKLKASNNAKYQAQLTELDKVLGLH